MIHIRENSIQRVEVVLNTTVLAKTHKGRRLYRVQIWIEGSEGDELLFEVGPDGDVVVGEFELVDGDDFEPEGESEDDGA